MKPIYKIYYASRYFVPRWMQIQMRRIRALYVEKRNKDSWPCRESYDSPFASSVWKNGNKFCLVLTHDVDTEKGMHRCMELMHLEKSMGFVSSFSIVPERYEVDEDVLREIQRNGFEICIHGLHHDGRLFESRKIFVERKKTIERYAQKWRAKGFRAPAMHHDMHWISEMDMLYDMSTYEFDPFEPQGGGVGTIFPFIIENPTAGKKMVEIPYTLPQDHTLFSILGRKSIDDWIKKIEYIAEKGGMASVITHPDYMTFGVPVGLDEYSFKRYVDFLTHIKENYQGMFWNPLPRELASYWIQGEKKASRVGCEVLGCELLCENCRKKLKKIIVC